MASRTRAINKNKKAQKILITLQYIVNAKRKTSDQELHLTHLLSWSQSLERVQTIQSLKSDLEDETVNQHALSSTFQSKLNVAIQPTFLFIDFPRHKPKWIEYRWNLQTLLFSVFDIWGSGGSWTTYINSRLQSQFFNMSDENNTHRIRLRTCKDKHFDCEYQQNS